MQKAQKKHLGRWVRVGWGHFGVLGIVTVFIPINPLCFCCLAQSSRALFQRWVSSGHFPGRLFFVFRCLGPIFWSPGGLLCSFFASWIPKGTYLCQLAPAGHQLGGKWGHQVDLCPSPVVAFRLYFLELCDFMKIELPCRRGLCFESPGPSKWHFFSLGALPKT